MKWVNMLLLLLAVAVPASPQEVGRLLGTLHDRATSRPIAGATIRIMAVHIEREFNVVTDDQGRFAYIGLLPGDYIVTITKAGYAAVDVFDVLIERGETTRLRLTMTPSALTSVKRQLIRYRRPLINTEDASIKYVFRTEVY